MASGDPETESDDDAAAVVSSSTFVAGTTYRNDGALLKSLPQIH